MVNEKEFNIIKALVDEEIESLRGTDALDSTLVTQYLFSLSDIVEKLRQDVAVRQGFSVRVSY